MKEIWKDVPGYGGVYQFSNQERMRTTDHYDAANRFFSGRIMKPHIMKGCKIYQLYKNNKRKDWNVKKLKSILFPDDIVSDSVWKPVVGFEKYYEVNEFGIVRSLEYEEFVNGCYVHRYPKILKQHINQDGYYMVKFRDNKNHSVHRIVAEAFIRKIDAGFEVDHIDGNRTNNHYKNLRVVTHQQNIQHTIELGNRLVGNTRGKNYNAKPVKIISSNNTSHCFECMMDACEYIKGEKNIKTSVVSMLGSMRAAVKRGSKYFGYDIIFI